MTNFQFWILFAGIILLCFDNIILRDTLRELKKDLDEFSKYAYENDDIIFNEIHEISNYARHTEDLLHNYYRIELLHEQIKEMYLIMVGIYYDENDNEFI